MFAAVTTHASAFRPVLPGETNSLGSSSPRSGDIGQASGPPHKQRKRPPPLPTATQKLTCGLLETYRHTNSSFVYVGSIQNPRRVLTKDARPSGNHGMDNKSSDLILTVGDVLVGPNGGHKFRVLDMLGQGTFGQVVKCRAEWDQERDDSSPLSACSPGTSPASSGVDDLRPLRKSTPNPQMVAVKIVKNKPAYFNQAKVEIKVLHKVSEELGPGKSPGDPGHSLIRLLYDFEYHHHLCLVFELMSVNLYELIKHQDFRGLPFARVRAFCEQLLDALDCLFRLGVIHCDLKPENILLENFGDPTTPRIKLIDLGSACYHDHVAFTYIQSRFYRAPEVLLGVKYSAPIDLWSLGCVAIELYMGLPVFPGVSAHNQLTRIVEMLGNPPNWMIEEGKKGETYFTPLSPSRDGTADIMEFDMREDYFSTSNQTKWKDGMQGTDEPNAKKHTSLHWSTPRYGQPPKQETPKWRIKTPHEWAFENGLRDGPEKTKRYVKEKTLPGIILKCESKRRPKNEPVESLSQDDLECFIDFCSGLLRLDPNERWTAAQAIRHPFIRQTRYDGPFVPRESITPEVVPEETEEDLLFASDEGPADLATDMAEMEMEVDYDEQEELEEEKRRIRTRAVPLAIAKPTSTSTSSTQPFGSASASSLTRGKSLGLSSSQQRYKRKLSESNSVAASPQTTASSLTSVMGSPIMRPDVPYPLAHQSRWSDLGVLASPKLGTLGLPYHSVLPPPVDQLGVNATPGGASRALSYGSSLPSQRGLMMQSQHHLGSAAAANPSDVHAFRRLEFQNFAPAGGSSGQTAQSLSSSLGGNVAPGQYWTFTGQFPSLQLGPQQPAQNPPSTILNHMSTGMPYNQQQQQRRSSLTEQSVDPTKFSSSWTGSSGSMTMRMSGEESDHRNYLPKKRAESEHFISVNTSSEAMNGGGSEPPVLLSPNANSVVVEKTLEKWAPFNKDEQKKTEEPTQSDKST